MMTLSFALGGGVDEVVDNGTNYQRCQLEFEADLFQCQTFTAIYLGNREGVC